MNFREHLDEMMKDPEFRIEYEALEPEFEIIRAMTIARNNMGLTQEQIAERSGMKQSDISRIERGKGNPSLKTLRRLAQAMDMEVKIEFVPSGHAKSKVTGAARGMGKAYAAPELIHLEDDAWERAVVQENIK